MSTLLLWSASFALGCLALAAGCAALRLLLGPTTEDRVLGLDALYINGMLIILVLGMRYGSDLYIDIALLIALFGFAGSAALAKFLLRGEVIEP